MSLRTALREYGWSRYAIKEAAVDSAAMRFVYDAATRSRATFALARGRMFDAARTVCQAMRLMEGHRHSDALARLHARVLRTAGNGDVPNALLGSYLSSGTAAINQWRYLCHGAEYAARMKFPRSPEIPRRQGNLLVLKAWDARSGEKGVLYLQYTESIAAFVALFDLPRVAEHYRLVVEPSSWGYQDESFLLLIRAGFDVLVQAQDAIDFRYIESLRANLRPLPFGAGDWIDPENFVPVPGDTKRFDFVMVASWSPVKRHTVFFDALARAGLQGAAVALVGYPWEGRTRADIEKLATRAGLTGVRIFERIPRAEVAAVIRQSRVGVMLTRREGANRGIYECLFCDVPIVVTASNRGVNKSLINAATGALAGDSDLPAALTAALARSGECQARRWALGHTGYHITWRALDAELGRLAAERGESYNVSIAAIRSAPAAAFVSDADCDRLDAEYANLQALLRPRA
jgi:glycosyltransferase involved in cell wall biosynthesis